METYKKYKPFAGKWLLQIPDSWEYVPTLRYMSSLVDYRGKTPEKVKDGVFLVTAKNIKNGRIDYEISKEFIDEEAYDEVMRRGKPEINDILFTTEAPLGEIALVDKIDIALAQRVIKFRPISELFDSIYLKYYFQSVFFQQTLRSLATGSTAIGIKSSKLCLLRSLKPSITEQTQIAKFLDYKTSQIDKLIEQKEKLLTLLTEKRTAIITQAVTKGLDPSVEMKNSGIEWLGEIPKHWEVKSLKRFAKICNGQDHKGVWDENGEYPILGSGGIFGRSNQFLHKGPSVLLGRKGTIDKPQYIQEPFWSVDTAYYTDIYKNTYPKFFYYLTTTINFDLYKYGSAVPSMTQTGLGQIPFATPKDINEQMKISDFLDKKISEYKNIEDQISKSINQLKEYREALITSAVTGQIDVRKEKIDE